MSIRMARWILLCGLVAAGAAAQTPQPSAGIDTMWPQRFEKDGNALLVYHPQMQAWPNRLEFTGRVAAVVLGKDGAASGGSLDIAARTDTDTATRSVALSNIRVTGAHFPGISATDAAAIARDLFPQNGLVLSLDYMLAALSLSGFGNNLVLTGATAGSRPFPTSAAFGPAKFAMRGLAQVVARDLAPQGIHVAYVNVDGPIDMPLIHRLAPGLAKEDMLDPAAIAETYWHLAHQHPSAWTQELDLRPFKEKF